ncbi:RsfA family transcriptional regulator [Metabacillus iocasae]|uniref:Prespore-specific regulator n=1 Tax=Priestia iocasae TaxID=2291674 RepID=A0ABS2QYP5_9BACI|nr:RsfA family transcriptional regulator [Metabacillus iocasae]MBM7704107.1 prespore-specific regulator [Metabacillus iocasae]
MKDRQDAWTEENDLLLAETVLRHVREGSTQLNAFEEVGDELNRTSAACGFRWNAVVRHQYEKALQLAKKQRKQRMRALGQTQGKKKLLYTPPTPGLDLLEELEETVETIETVHAEPALVPPTTSTYSSPSSKLTLEGVIQYLQTLSTQAGDIHVLRNENLSLSHENKDLKQKNQELMKKVELLEANATTIQEDYETLMQIMNRARKFVLLDDEERPSTKFKMDRNGNLEKLAE